MNTSALKSFSQEARIMLRDGVERRINYWGFDKKGKSTATVEAVTGGYTFRGKVSDDSSVPSKWNKLKAAIDVTSYDEVVEKAAYTWFNRLMAMKILSKSGYETTQLDYLADETNIPAILERARRGQFTFLNPVEKKRLQPVLTDYEKEQDAFAILLIGYCHQHPLLQGIFGSIDDYTELLLPDDILTENGFLNFLNTTDAITDNDYKQVELIGWLYQFYISEKKDEVFASFKQNKKAEAKDIPAATQIFTPNWIVKYLVQNTLGRTWLDAHPESDLKKDWKYLVEPSPCNPQTATPDSRLLSPNSLTFLDPAVGSGHILAEAFDLLYPMYMAEYYSPEEAIQSILEKNLFGLDLDLRAIQLAQFALILKAAQYSRTVLRGNILPHIYAMPQHRIFTKDEVVLFLGKENAEYVNQVYKALQTMEQANNLGSIMVLELSDDARGAVENRYHDWQQTHANNFEEEIVKEVFPGYIPILLILTNKLTCISANPPYMSSGNMNLTLKNYVSLHYPLTKSDLFAAFMDLCSRLLTSEGRFGMINMHSWMFLSTYEAMRTDLLSNRTMENMIHLGPRTFDELSGEVVQNTAFILNVKRPADVTYGTYYRLVSYKGSYEKQSAFEKRSNEFLNVLQNSFSKIPGNPIAYWVNENIKELFRNKCVGDYAFSDGKNVTGENEKYLRFLWEVNYQKIGVEKKWFLLTKGGEFRKWYGNTVNVIDWSQDARDHYRKSKIGRIIPEYIWYKRGITWSKIASGKPSFRILREDSTFDEVNITFNQENHFEEILALLNSNISLEILKILNPTFSFQTEDILTLPFIPDIDSDYLKRLVNENIEISRKDWNSRETSWDFQSSPLIDAQHTILEGSFCQWLKKVSKDFFQLRINEEELNRIFIDLYGLQAELTSNVSLRDLTILQDELDYDALEQIEKPYEGKLVPVYADAMMQQLISYMVGCYMGRYRLDKPGLHIAHPNPKEEELVPYFVKTGEEKHFQFQIDDDAVIPIMGRNGNFTDDMLQKVKEFLSIIWGDDSLTENINFLQKQLDKNLEDYLVKDFWKYHVKTYSKKPIYWLFASKKGAFQVLVYMHRMNAFTLAKIRSKYLIPHISWLQNLVIDMEKNAATLNRTELKKLDTFRKQLVECEEYDLLLKDMADQQISFDLDDGVTNNYALFKGVVAEIK